LLLEGPDATLGGTGLWFPVVQCHDCGLCFTNPRPTPESIAQFYPPEYPPHQIPSPERQARRPSRFLAGYRNRYHSARQGLDWHGQGRLLDFGCGGGSFLERMHRQGWQVSGVDVSTVAVQRVCTELGLRALAGSLPNPKLDPASFDIITMWQSLEHVHDPLTVLREARRLLAPGGQLIVVVPNIDSLPFRWFGHAWYSLDLPRHLVHFAPWTLQLMLQRAGFQVGPIQMVRHSHWLRGSARLACQQSVQPERWHRLLRLKPVSRLATWYSYLTRQADCMMVTAHR
jgi:SAM-dependent methyltransferase